MTDEEIFRFRCPSCGSNKILVLAGLLDEDQFAECEALLLAAGVMPEEKDNVAKA